MYKRQVPGCTDIRRAVPSPRLRTVIRRVESVGAADSENAVSYTHLTLPTSDLV